MNLCLGHLRVTSLAMAVRPLFLLCSFGSVSVSVILVCPKYLLALLRFSDFGGAFGGWMVAIGVLP